MRSRPQPSDRKSVKATCLIPMRNLCYRCLCMGSFTPLVHREMGRGFPGLTKRENSQVNLGASGGISHSRCPAPPAPPVHNTTSAQSDSEPTRAARSSVPTTLIKFAILARLTQIHCWCVAQLTAGHCTFSATPDFCTVPGT
jgi:hypothetical protein